ncbi:MAG: ABC transporter permease [Mycolicibacterium hassiacum]|jgi:type III secretory pathway component EscS|uniref:ABC transporter permease n=1 Tax=Mycolicibacterium hassiacum TaxID=46351 RepID=UPI0023F73393|nr:ABC transporter permease [Mycolicibacterium hassiacum]MBX5486563.1 ABC transporter permease [Mycolicibacterium hassiacum]
MSALAVLNCERIKLTTTRSTLWIALVVAALSLSLAALQGILASGVDPLTPERAALGITVFGVPVLMVLASMTMTAEYRSGMIRTTFAATPRRTRVLVAKAIVAAVFAAVWAALLVVASVVVARVLTGAETGWRLSLSAPEVWRVVIAVAVYAGLAAVIGVAVGALVRAGPGAVAALLLWPLVVEPILGNLPDVGPAVGPYLPFANAFRVTEVPWLYPGYEELWGQLGSLVYFALVVMAVFAAAVVVLNVRDA